MPVGYRDGRLGAGDEPLIERRRGVVAAGTGVASGVLLYAGVGVATLLLGGNYLDYSVLRHDPVDGQHLGILLIEFGVGTTVASVMITVFYTFASSRR